ncbi:MAG: hypothetical protein OHK0038_00950 [Flammeovirgaceae bacterium]
MYLIIKLIFCLLLVFSFNASAQKYLVLDNYGLNRTLLKVGDDINFRQKGNKTWYKDKILALKDTSLILEEAQMEIALSQLSQIRFRRGSVKVLASGTDLLAGGFLFSAAVYPLVGEPNYSQQESTIIGLTSLALGQVVRRFKWKKYKLINQNTRIQIIDTSFK